MNTSLYPSLAFADFIAGYDHFMVDVETFGLRPSIHEMSSVALVCFDPELGIARGDAGLHMRVDHSVCNHGREKDKDTRVWRANNGVDEMEDEIKTTCSPKTTCLQIAEYMRAVQLQTGKPAMIWAKPTKFDIAFLETYFALTGTEKCIPYNHRNTCDLQSWARGAGVDPARLLKWAIKDLASLADCKGKAHDAMHDCLLQIRMVYHAVEVVKLREAGWGSRE